MKRQSRRNETSENRSAISANAGTLHLLGTAAADAKEASIHTRNTLYRKLHVAVGAEQIRNETLLVGAPIGDHVCILF